MESHDILIRDAFSKVKEDMTSHNQKIDGLNDNIMSLKEDLDELRNDTATKDMVTAAEKELLELKGKVYYRDAVDKNVGRIDARIDSLSTVIDKREKLMEDVKEIKNIRKQLDAHEGKFISKGDLKKLFDKLNEDLLFVDKRLSEIEDQTYYMDEVEKSFTSKSDFKDQISGISKRIKERDQAVADRMTKLETQFTRIEEEAANLNEIGRLDDDIRGMASRLVVKEDFNAMRARLDNLEKDYLASQRKKTQEMEKQLTVLIKKANGMDASLSKLDTELSQIYDLTDKSASKENLSVIKKELGIMMEGLQGLGKLKQEVSELKKGHKEHKAVTKDIQKKLKPGKVQLLLQRDNPKRGI